MFDVNDFLNTAYTDIPPDQATPIPVGEYNVQIDPGEKGVKIAQGEKDGNAWARCDLRLLIEDPAKQLAATHGDNPTMFYGIMLDLDDNGRLDFHPNRNVKLGKVLEATGVRKAGWKFTDLSGKRLRIKVVHEPDRQDPTIPRANVAAVSVAQ